MLLSLQEVGGGPSVWRSDAQETPGEECVWALLMSLIVKILSFGSCETWHTSSFIPSLNKYFFSIGEVIGIGLSAWDTVKNKMNSFSLLLQGFQVS